MKLELSAFKKISGNQEIISEVWRFYLNFTIWTQILKCCFLVQLVLVFTRAKPIAESFTLKMFTWSIPSAEANLA